MNYQTVTHNTLCHYAASRRATRARNWLKIQSGAIIIADALAARTIIRRHIGTAY